MSSTTHFDVIITGAGIVGLATAYQLQQMQPGWKVAILEKEDGIAQHQTGHNSGVIHSGIYYKPGSLKAQNCIAGRQMLLDFCDEHQVAYALTGKVIVATEEKELPILEGLLERGRQNGLEGLELLDRAGLKAIEPHAEGIKAIRVPQAGIIDYTAVAQKLAELIREKGGEIFCGEEVTGVTGGKDAVVVETWQQQYTANMLVNCAGLYADKLATMTGQKIDFKIIPFRGEYYELLPDKHHLMNHLIYPVPDPAFPFLGVHFTRMIGGGIEAGPNAVLALRREGYGPGPMNLSELAEIISWPGLMKLALKHGRTGMGELYRSYSKSTFTKALQKLIPEIREADLKKGGAGVRAQACSRDGKLIDDFLILESERVVNVCNAPSPAATSSLSIGKMCAERIVQNYV